MPQPQPQQGGFVILPLPQAVAGAPPHPPRCNGKLSWVVPPVVPDPVVHFPVILTPPGPPHVRVFPSPHDRWGGGMPEPVIPDGAPFPGPVHPGPFMGHPMDDGPFVPHSPSDGSPPQVIVQPAVPRHDPRHSRTYTVPHSDRGSPNSDMPTQESFHQYPPVRPIPIPAPMGEHIEHIPGSAILVPPSPTMGHPPAPQNIINVGTPVTLLPPGMPPPGQVGAHQYFQNL